MATGITRRATSSASIKKRCAVMPAAAIRSGWKEENHAFLPLFTPSCGSADALCIVQHAGGGIADYGVLASWYLVRSVLFCLVHDADGAGVGGLALCARGIMTVSACLLTHV